MNPWPADRVERRAVSSLVPYARNARTHSDAQVKQIAASMREWGVTNPILIAEDSTIIAGHARVMAAKQLGLTEYPVMIAEGWSDEQKRAFVLADNQLALNGGWNNELLAFELKDLKGLGADLTLIGFGGAVLERLTGDVVHGLTDPDAVPEASNLLGVKPGDLWRLGDHWLKCGNACNEADVAEALGPWRPHLMVTDPPYGVDYDPDWRNRVLPMDGKRRAGAVQNDNRADWREAWALFPGAVAYVWHLPQRTAEVQASLASARLLVRAQIVWVKQHFVISRGHYHSQHEPLLYAVKAGATAHWQGDHKQTTVWEIANSNAFGGEREDDHTHHSTQKPVECMRRPIVNNSAPGDRIYDPFVGSGTSIIAAEMTGRVCHAIDIDPLYCDVAIRRWQEFTGKEATCERGHQSPPISSSSKAIPASARSTKTSPGPKSKSRKSPSISPPMPASNGSGSPASS